MDVLVGIVLAFLSTVYCYYVFSHLGALSHTLTHVGLGSTKQAPKIWFQSQETSLITPIFFEASRELHGDCTTFVLGFCAMDTTTSEPEQGTMVEGK